VASEKIKSFKELRVWQKGHEFVLEVYKITKEFPKEEIFSLISQMRRSSMSITANIAEGFGRGHTQEFIQMLYISRGSLEETKYFLILSRDLKYIHSQTYQELMCKAEEIGSMLQGLIKSLKQKADKK